jgi:hypothetical protein
LKSHTDKAHYDSIKAQADAEKVKLDIQQLILETQHSKDIYETTRLQTRIAKEMARNALLEINKTHIQLEQSNANIEQSRLDTQKLRLESVKAMTDLEKTRIERIKLNMILDKTQLDLDKDVVVNDTKRLDIEHMQLVTAKSQIDADKITQLTEQTRLYVEKLRLEAQLETDKITQLTEQNRLYVEKLRLEAQLEADKICHNTHKTQCEAETIQFQTAKTLLQIKQEETIKAQCDAEIAQLETNKILALANTAKDNATIIRSHIELEQIYIEKTRLELEKSRMDLIKSHVNNAPDNAIKEHTYAIKAQTHAIKTQTDALIVVQRSKIMKTLQLLSMSACKRVDELYFNKSVTSITNIYQKTYNNNKYASGFGDFIRGCYFVLDFCEMFHFQPNIVINHPLEEFLENHDTRRNYSIIQMVSMFEDNNWSKHILNHDNIIINTIRKKDSMSRFETYLCSSHIENNNINIYNILFPYFDVSAEHQEVMRDILKPSQEMKEYVVSTLNKFELTENNYISIHIRSGDNYLNGVDKQFNATYLNHITNNIIALLNKYPNACFILIADNNFIKLHLSSKKIHRLYIIFNEIGHLGENTQLERDNIKNTMLDFYLFAHSSNIYAFSSYDHGSGFSFWCAKTYGIPYSCKIIKH